MLKRDLAHQLAFFEGTLWATCQMQGNTEANPQPSDFIDTDCTT